MPDEFEIRDKVHPYLRVFFPRQTKPYYINRIVIHGQPPLSYTVYISTPKGEYPQLVYRGENSTEVMDDPIRVEANYDVQIELVGLTSAECSLFCSPGKKND